MKLLPFMYLVGYNQDFIKTCNTGWGCGYVAIPLDHILVINHFRRIAEEEAKEESYYYHYLQVDFEQEITYTETKNINGADYLVIGFDTAHSFNSIEKHDFDYVFTETARMLNDINLLN